MAFDFDIIDIHAHLLPGLDDGPGTLEESLRMCEMYVEQGVSTVIATPHMCVPRFGVAAGAVRRGVEGLSQACRDRGLNLQILPGADVCLQPGLLEALDGGDALTLADQGKYLLLELPGHAVPPIEELILELGARGVTLIVSHPERNPEFWRRPDRLAKLVEQGCLVQITAGSLFGAFASSAKRAAKRFIEAGLAHVVASDAHAASGRRRPQLRGAAEWLASKMGEDTARELLRANPAEIIRGGAAGRVASDHRSVGTDKGCPGAAGRPKGLGNKFLTWKQA